jgi:hypothetical protein
MLDALTLDQMRVFAAVATPGASARLRRGCRARNRP